MASVSTLKDGFQDNSIDSGLWTATVTGSDTVVEANQRLEITVNSGASGHARLTSNATYDLTGSAVYIKFARTSGTGDDYARLRVTDPSGDYYEIVYWAGGLYASYNGSQFGGNYGLSGNEWWRIREDGGTIYFDTAAGSGDDPPSSWTLNRTSQTKNANFDATAVTVSLRANYVNGTSTVNTFDGLNDATTYEPPAADTIARGLYL